MPTSRQDSLAQGKTRPQVQRPLHLALLTEGMPGVERSCLAPPREEGSGPSQGRRLPDLVLPLCKGQANRPAGVGGQVKPSRLDSCSAALACTWLPQCKALPQAI